MWQNESLCKLLVWKHTPSVLSFAWKSSDFHVKHTSTCSANGSSDGGSQVCIMSQALYQASTHCSFCSRNWLGEFLLPNPPGWDASSITGLPPNINFSCQYLFIHLRGYWGTVRVKCLAQEHNTMFPARAWTQTAWNRIDIQKSNNDWGKLVTVLVQITLCKIIIPDFNIYYRLSTSISLKWGMDIGKILFTLSYVKYTKQFDFNLLVNGKSI